jgi:hypothetical protein
VDSTRSATVPMRPAATPMRQSIATARSGMDPAHPVATPTRPAVLEPLAPDCYRVQFSASTVFYEKLRRAQNLLRHQIPSGNPAEVFERALTLLLEHLERTKLAATKRPRAKRAGHPRRRPESGAPDAPESGAPDGREGRAVRTRYIPARVRRAVWERDGARCAFTSADGRRCGERGQMEFHHVEPHATGGRATVENISLRCRAHNGYEAELVFGPYRPQTPGKE